MVFEDIRIYDKDFKLLTILPKYIAVNWEIKFSEFGLGEIELEKTEEILKLLTENEYLFLFQGDIQSIVTGYKVGETITIFTRTLEWLLTKFVVTEFTVKELMDTVYSGVWSGTKLVEHILNNNLPKAFNLVFTGLESDKTDMTDFVLKGVSDVYSVITSIITDKKTGFKFYVDTDTKKFTFKMVTATDNTNTMLCDEYRTSYESEYSYDIQDEASGGAFYHAVTNMGRWDAELNSPELSNNDSTNYGKYYTVSKSGSKLGFSVEKGDIILCKNVNGAFEIVEKAEPFLVEFPPEDKGIFSWTAHLNSQDMTAAKKELSDKKALDMLTCKTKLFYMDDFKLGDIIKVKFFAEGMSCEKNKLISEIHLWDEPGETGTSPVTTDIT